MSLGTYLQQITLLTDADKNEEDSDVVKLMTIHAAKGLEFPIIFVGGLEESIFPSGMSINTREELEEERRLFYVAITRAKEKLWLTYANTRYRFGNLVQNDPSRFIEEMPPSFVDKSSAGNSFNANNFSNGFQQRNSNFDNRISESAEKRYGPPPAKKLNTKPSALPSQPPVTAKIIEHKPQADFTPSDTSNLAEGDKVEHLKFGFGTVIKMEGAAHNRIATVHFKLNGEKKIMLNYAKLRILEN
jgi:DNA helicase-2/ATP-dependent DNA helicase PcrA